MQLVLLRLSLVLCSCLTFRGTAANNNGIFVSPSGNDNVNDGSVVSPFLTLHRAQQAARLAKQRLGLSPLVVLEQGTHRLHTQPPVVLTAEDGGTAQTEALWVSSRPNASHGNGAGAARVSGGVPLSHWEQAPGDDRLWRTNASALANSTSWPFRTLRVGDRLWPSTRWPLDSADWLFLADWSCDPQFHPCSAPINDEMVRLHTERLESTIPASLGIDPRDLSAVRDFASADLHLFGGFERDVFSQVLPLRRSPSPWNVSNPSRPTLAIECYGCRLQSVCLCTHRTVIR